MQGLGFKVFGGWEVVASLAPYVYIHIYMHGDGKLLEICLVRKLQVELLTFEPHLLLGWLEHNQADR